MDIRVFPTEDLFCFDDRGRADSEFLADHPEPPVLRPRVAHPASLPDLGLTQPLRVTGHEDGRVSLGGLEAAECDEEVLQPPGELRARGAHSRVQGEEAVRQAPGGLTPPPLPDVGAPAAAWR